MNIKKISPCPIIESTIQINCTFTIDQDIVVGLIYSLLQNRQEGKVLQIEKLPILNLPEEIRKTDPNLRNKPCYKINYGEFYILIGLFGVALGVNPPYKGWKAFKEFSIDFLDLLVKGNIVIKGLSAITLKYLDFFSDVNIFEKINCEVLLNNKKITTIPTIFRTEIPINDFTEVLQITNGVHLRNQALKINNDGSLIEISLFRRNVSVENFSQVIEDAHFNQKESFFGLLSNEYLKSSFNIEYEQE